MVFKKESYLNKYDIKLIEVGNMHKKIIFLLIVLGIVLNGCQIAEEQTEEPIETGEEELNETEDVLNETVETEGETESINATEPEEELNETIEPEEEINATEPEENVLTIEIDHLTLSQKDVVIEKGTTVRWENKENNKHKLTIYGLVQSPILYQGDSFNYTFNEVGEYIYICAIFKTYIRGTVTVE